MQLIDKRIVIFRRKTHFPIHFHRETVFVFLIYSLIFVCLVFFFNGFSLCNVTIFLLFYKAYNKTKQKQNET